MMLVQRNGKLEGLYCEFIYDYFTILDMKVGFEGFMSIIGLKRRSNQLMGCQFMDVKRFDELFFILWCAFCNILVVYGLNFFIGSSFLVRGSVFYEMNADPK